MFSLPNPSGSSGSAIKSIQSGLVTMVNAGANPTTATVAQIDVAKSFLIINADNTGNVVPYVEITNPRTLSFTRQVNNATVNIKWQLVEFN